MFARFAWGVLAYNLGVVLWGAYVRASGSGAGCGRHWPLCNGVVVPQAPDAKTLVELAHRISSGLALIAVVVLYLWARRSWAPGNRVRQAAGWALLFMIFEALVGAGLVLFELVDDDDSLLRAGYLALHLLNTFILLAAIALTAWWAGAPEERPAPGPGAPALLVMGLAATLLVGMTGAVTALGDTLFPADTLRQGLAQDFSPTAHLLIRLRVIHPGIAIGTGAYLLAVTWWLGKRQPEGPAAWWGRAVSGLVLFQLGIGVVNLLLLAPIGLQLAHLLTADLLWVALVLYTAATSSASSAPRAAW